MKGERFEFWNEENERKFQSKLKLFSSPVFQNIYFHYHTENSLRGSKKFMQIENFFFSTSFQQVNGECHLMVMREYREFLLYDVPCSSLRPTRDRGVIWNLLKPHEKWQYDDYVDDDGIQVRAKWESFSIKILHITMMTQWIWSWYDSTMCSTRWLDFQLILDFWVESTKSTKL